MKWISRWWAHLLILLIMASALWASFHRSRRAAHVRKAHEAKREDIDRAKTEQAKAAVSAAKATEILNRQRDRLDKLEDHDDKTVADRARAINQRMRDATRTRD